MVSNRVSRVLNSTKSIPIKVPEGTPLGSAGYDNPRDDIEKVKKIREGSVEKVPIFSNDIVNKLYADSLVAGATGNFLAAGGETVTVVNGLVTDISIIGAFLILLETGDSILMENNDRMENG